MPPRRPFHLRRLKTKAWLIKKLPASQRREAANELLDGLKQYLEALKRHG
jgi:hypothetical protein